MSKKSRGEVSNGNKPVAASDLSGLPGFAGRRCGRILLILMAFFSGAAIMIIELCANRVLAPWFGNSLYTWTGIIGIILVAISCGYYLGGWLVDRKPHCTVLSHLFLASALFAVAVPFLQQTIEGSFSEAGLVWGPLLASLILFTLPACVLGAIPPCAVRLTSLSYQDKRIGISAGTVGMFATLGSVAGTFTAGFFLIPQMGVKTIFFLVAGVLAFLALAGYVVFSSLSMKTTKFCLGLSFFLTLFSLAMSFVKSPLPSDVLFEQATFYHRIRVVQERLQYGDVEKTLFLDTTVEGAQYEISREIPIAYQRYWELIKVFCPDLDRAAFLGAGAYTMPISLSRDFPGAGVDVIEIDPRVVEVGRMFFHLDEYAGISPIVDDARRHICRTGQKYDLIFGDAFNGVRNIPSHLVTVEFFRLIGSRLTEKGVYMMNIISAIEGEHSRLFAAIGNTLSKAFKEFHVFALHPHDLDSVQNVVIVACNRELQFGLDSRWTDAEQYRLGRLLATYVPSHLYHVADAPVLSDDFNPVEYIIAQDLH